MEILTRENQARDLGGIYIVLVPGSEPPPHYQGKRESIVMTISGEALEIMEGKEIPIKGSDVIFISPGEKHTTLNTSHREFRYREFFIYIYPPAGSDFVEVK